MQVRTSSYTSFRGMGPDNRPCQTRHSNQSTPSPSHSPTTTESSHPLQQQNKPRVSRANVAEVPQR
ncbi:hypothetical protein E2C01_094534 [Portunus trituberculatus]|uniref:Uncharacterized protein n=1 Tax=Portunus trituberculatus TaxID=210409 RepID=A0A5B7K1X3_PORTR|nr:hypothetical protein [Portunus trituberculatus]